MLNKEGLNVRVVSMPCMEEFNSQSNSYKSKVLLKDSVPKLVVEAGVGDSWDKYLSSRCDKIVMNTFGVSAPGGDALAYFGFTAKNIIKRVKKLIKNTRR